MNTYLYITEHPDYPQPDVLLFATEAEMQEKFIADIISDERDPYGEDDMHREEGDDGATLSDLKALQDREAPLGERFELASRIYDAVTESGLYSYPWHYMEEREVPEPEPTRCQRVCLGCTPDGECQLTVKASGQ